MTREMAARAHWQRVGPRCAHGADAATAQRRTAQGPGRDCRTEQHPGQCEDASRGERDHNTGSAKAVQALSAGLAQVVFARCFDWHAVQPLSNLGSRTRQVSRGHADPHLAPARCERMLTPVSIVTGIGGKRAIKRHDMHGATVARTTAQDQVQPASSPFHDTDRTLGTRHQGCASGDSLSDVGRHYSS